MSRDNVGALIDADKAVHEEMRLRYPDGPYQDGMYGTGMLLELGRLGFVVVPTSDWQRLLADTPSVEPPVGRKPTARRRHAQRLFDAARPSVEPKETTDDEDFPPGFFLRPETLNKLRESIPADWLRPSVEPLDADILGMALDLVDEEDMRVGVVGRGRKVDRVVAEYNRLLPTQASDSPEKTT